MPTATLEQAYAGVRREIERAEVSNWSLAGGLSAPDLLRKLKQDVDGVYLAGRKGSLEDSHRLRGLIRWVADWVPDLDAPLLDAVAEFVFAAERWG